MAFWKGGERVVNWSSLYTKWETEVNEPTTGAFLCVASQEECMAWCRKNNGTKAEWYPVRFHRGRSTTDKISTLQKFSRNPGSMPKTYKHVLSTSGRYGRVLHEKLWGCYGSTVLTGASCWPSSNCILTQKIVSVSMELTHNRSELVMDSDNGVCCHHSSS